MHHYEVLLIDVSLLAERVFNKFYRQKLKPILKKIQKEIYVPYDEVRRIQERRGEPLYDQIYKTHLSIQKWGIKSVGERLEDLVKNKKALLLTKDKNLARRVVRLNSGAWLFSASKRCFERVVFSQEDISKPKFKVHTSQNTLHVSTIPKEGEQVFLQDKGQKRPITLTKEVKYPNAKDIWAS